jgi:hypothetical protein
MSVKLENHGDDIINPGAEKFYGHGWISKIMTLTGFPFFWRALGY